MKIYCVYQIYCDDEGEWLDMEKMFKTEKSAKEFYELVVKENECERTSYMIVPTEVFE